ncbi:PEP-CTERM sorting domain-containing protein [Rubritalea tangerina]|uniref:PEP-CTERM sorting domain-containing protein n=1 Tax=Rubritalea tangerina TaxID=430798 RepID=A0ABW4Z8T7_9BACT
MKKTSLLLALTASCASAAIVDTSYVAGSSSPYSYLTATPLQLLNSSGLNTPVNAGDSLASAQSATHDYNLGFEQSWTTNDPGGQNSDYFASGGLAPILVFDLGQDYDVQNLIFWQYQNSGSIAGVDVANNAKTIEVRYNTEAEGNAAFTGSATTLNLLNAVELNAPGIGRIPSQTFSASNTTARYIQLTITDNHFGNPSAGQGGDRVGLGEFRVDASAVASVPEPSSLACLAIGASSLLLRRSRKKA